MKERKKILIRLKQDKVRCGDETNMADFESFLYDLLEEVAKAKGKDLDENHELLYKTLSDKYCFNVKKK